MENFKTEESALTLSANSTITAQEFAEKTTIASPTDIVAESDRDGSLKEAEKFVEDEDEVEYASGLKLGAIVVALVLSIFLVSLDSTIVATAIPKITDEFQGLDLVGWYGSGFFLTLASFQSTWGKGYKYFPLKMTFLISIFIFELGSLICGVAPNSTALIVGRAIAGIGGAGITSGAYTIIGFAVPPKSRPAFTGILGASYGLASVAGPLLGGVFADKTTWRWCFYINLPIGGLAGIIIFIFFQAPPAAVPVDAPLLQKLLQMDPLGTFTVMAAVICFILALQYGGNTHAWNSGPVIGTLVAFGLLTIIFVVSQYFLGEHAMVIGRILKKRTIYVGMIFIFFLSGTFFDLLYYLPIYFQVVSGVSPAQSGVRNIPLILGCTIGTISSGILISITGHFVPMLISGGAITTIGAGLLYTLEVGSSSGAWIGYQALAGLAIGWCLQVPMIAAQAVSEPADLSSVTAMILFAQTMGGAFFVSAGQSALTNLLIANLPFEVPNIDPATIVAVGATQLRNTFPAEVIPGIVNSYLAGLHACFAIAIASAGVATVVSLGSRWKSIKGVNVSAAV